MASRATLGRPSLSRASPGQSSLTQGRTGDDTIQAVKILVYVTAFAAVIAVAVAIALLSVIVAPLNAQRDGLTLLAVALGGLAVAGGIIYLVEKLIYLAKEVAFMVARYIVEKYEKHRFDSGVKVGRNEERQAWQAWYRRQQEALRDGRPFDEPPPGSDSENSDHPGESS